MLTKFTVTEARWKGVYIAQGEAELHTAVVDGDQCSFQIRWFTEEEEGVRDEVSNIVSEITVDHAVPLLDQLKAAFLASFPQAVEV